MDGATTNFRMDPVCFMIVLSPCAEKYYNGFRKQRIFRSYEGRFGIAGKRQDNIG